MPAILERIDRAIALQMAPLAQAFAGVLIRDESQARRGNDPTSRISVDLRIDEACSQWVPRPAWVLRPFSADCLLYVQEFSTVA